MCLSNLQLKLEPRTKFMFFTEYVGVGYKAIPEYMYSEERKFTYKFRWQRSKSSDYTEMADDSEYRNYRGYYTGYLQYVPGFHIFLNEDHALSYGYQWYSHNKFKIFKVEFKDVQAFGTNNIGYRTSRKVVSDGACVVADKMKLIEEVLNYRDAALKFAQTKREKRVLELLYDEKIFST